MQSNITMKVCLQSYHHVGEQFRGSSGTILGASPCGTGLECWRLRWLHASLSGAGAHNPLNSAAHAPPPTWGYPYVGPATESTAHSPHVVPWRSYGHLLGHRGRSHHPNLSPSRSLGVMTAMLKSGYSIWGSGLAKHTVWRRASTWLIISSGGRSSGGRPWGRAAPLRNSVILTRLECMGCAGVKGL